MSLCRKCRHCIAFSATEVELRVKETSSVMWIYRILIFLPLSTVVSLMVRGGRAVLDFLKAIIICFVLLTLRERLLSRHQAASLVTSYMYATNADA